MAWVFLTSFSFTGNLDTLTEMEACCARLLIEKYKHKFTHNLLRLVMKHGAEEAGRIYGSVGNFARDMKPALTQSGIKHRRLNRRRCNHICPQCGQFQGFSDDRNLVSVSAMNEHSDVSFTEKPVKSSI